MAEDFDIDAFVDGEEFDGSDVSDEEIPSEEELAAEEE